MAIFPTFDPAAPEAEQTAWAAGLNLHDPPPDFDTTLPDGTTPRGIATETYRKYYEHRKAQNLPLFPKLAAQARETEQAEFKKAFQGLEHLQTNLRPDQWSVLDAAATGETDPDEFRARAVNASWLKSLVGRDIPPEHLSSVRDAYAKQVLGLTDDITDKAVYNAVKARFAEDDADDATVASYSKSVALKMLDNVGKKDTTARTLGNDEIVGFTRPGPKDLTYSPTTGEIDKALAGVSARNRPAARKQLLGQVSELNRMFRRFGPAVDRIAAKVDQITSGAFGDQETAMNREVDHLMRLLPDHPKERGVVLAMLSNKLQGQPQEKLDALGRIVAGVNRGFVNTKESVMAFGREGARQVARSVPYGNPNNFPAISDDAMEYETRRKELLNLIQGQGMSLEGAADGLFTQGLVKFAPSAWMIPAAFHPVGQMAIAATMSGDSISNDRLQNPGTQEGLRFNAGVVSGTAQAVIETLSNTTGAKILMGRLPSFTGILNKTGIASPAGRAALGFAAGGAATFATEYTEEAAQGATDLALQGLASDLSGIDPNIDWTGYLGGWLGRSKDADGKWQWKLGQEQRDTLLAILPFAMVGAGGAGLNHFRYGDAVVKNKSFLRAHGMTEPEIRTITATTDPAETQKNFQAAFQAAAARAASLTPEEQAAIDEHRATAIAKLTAQNEACARGGFPHVVSEENTFTGETDYIFIHPETDQRQVFDTQEGAMGAWWDWSRQQEQDHLDTVAQVAEEGFIEHVTAEGQAAENVNAEVKATTLTLPKHQQELQDELSTAEKDQAKAGNPVQKREAGERIAAAQKKLGWLKARIEAMVLDEGLTPSQAGQAFRNTIIAGRVFATSVMGRIAGYTVQLFNGRNLQDVIEEFSEANIRQAIDGGMVDPEILLDDIRNYEKATGRQVIDPAYQYDPANPVKLIEGFSNLARAYAMSQVRTGALPPTVARWIEMQTAAMSATVDAGTALSRDVRTAGDLREAIAAGNIPPRLVRAIQDSIGLDPQARERRLEKQMQDQLAAEAMGGFPEISEEAKGRLPHPDTLRKANHPLAGEVQRLWESLVKPTKRRAKNGRTIDRTNEANGYFLPVGEMADLDKVRQFLNQKGFDFTTPAEMLDALDASLSYGKPFYGTSSTGDEGAATFSLGRSAVTLKAPSPDGNPYRNADGTLRIPDRASSRNDPALASYERKFIELLDDPEKADALYNALPDSKGGKVIGTDIVRELLPEFAASREGKLRFTNATGRAAQAYAKDRLWREIHQRGDRETLMFTAGGVAAGKSTVVTDELVNAHDLIFDGTLRETAWAIDTIEQGLKNGWEDVVIEYIQRPIDLVIQGAIDRAERIGRWGSIADLPAVHQAAQQSILGIAGHFQGNPRVGIHLWLNAGETKSVPATEITLSQIDKGGELSYLDADDRRGTKGAPQEEQASDPERFRSASRGAVVSRFTAAVASGSYSAEVLVRLAQGDAELEGIVATSGIEATYALTTKAITRIEEAIAKKMTQGPDERAEFYERIRERLAVTVLRLRETKGNMSTTASEVERETTRIRDAIAEARAVIDALPIDARGRVNLNFDDITRATTPRGQANALIRLIHKADDVLETVLVKQYQEAFEKLADLAKPDLRQNKQVRGRLTPETQRLVGKAVAATVLEPETLAAELVAKQASIDALEARTPASPEDAAAMQKQLVEHYVDLDILNTFGALSTRDAAETAHAYQQLLAIYIKGRTTRKILDESRQAEIKAAKAEVLAGLPRVDQAKHNDRLKDKGFKDTAEGLRLGLSSFHQVMEWFFPNSSTARAMQDRVRKADNAFRRAKSDANERFDRFTFRVWNLAGMSATRKRNAILAAISKQRTDWNIQLAEGISYASEKLTEEQAAKILAGTMKVGWETDRIAMTSLAQALADFRMQRLKAQNEDKSFTATVIRFQRLTHRGTPGPLHLSDLQAVYYLQLWDQEQYRPALDKHGFTESVIDQLRAKVDPRALDIADFLRGEYDAQWGRLNPVYRALYGMDMPRIRNYAPGIFESLDSKAGQGMDELGQASGQVNAMQAGFTKSRTHHMARPREVNALTAFWSSNESTEYFIAYAEIVRDMRQIFRSPDLRYALEGNFGAKAANLFGQWLDAIEVDGNFKAAEVMAQKELVDKMFLSQVFIGLAYNTTVLMKQLPAAMGVLMEMPNKHAFEGIVRAIRNPASLKHVWNSEAIQLRILEGFSPETRKLLDAAHASPSWTMEMLALGTLPIQYVDAAATTLSASVAYNYHLAEATRQGLGATRAEEFALAAAARVIQRTAQPVSAQDKSMTELTAKGWTRALIMFKSDPRKQLGIVMDAYAQARRGTGDWGTFGRKFFWGWAVYGLMNQVMADAAMAMFRDGDDPDKWDWKDYAAAMLLGPVNAIPILGAFAELAVRRAFGGRVFVNSSNLLESGASNLLRKIPQIYKELTDGVDNRHTVNEILTDVQQLAAAAASVASAFDPRAAILPAAARLARDAEGVIANTSDALHTATPEEKALEIARAAKEETKTARDGRSEELKKLVSRLGKLDPASRVAELDRLDKDTRAAVVRKLKQASMTASEQTLANLPKTARAAAIGKITAGMTTSEKTAYQQRLKSLGID